MKKNVASQSIGAQMASATDGSAFTGTVTVYVTGDAGTQAIGSVGSGICTHEGNGFHTYAPAQAETNYDQVAFTFIGTGAIPSTIQMFTQFPQTVDNDVLAAGATGFTAIDTVVDTILVDTGELQTNQGNWLTATGFATPTNITAATGIVLSGVTHTGAVIPSVTLTDTVTTLTNLPAITTNWLTATGINASAFTAAKFAAASLDGKGDWNIGKTGYSLTQTFPPNFADLAVTITSGEVTVGTNNDKTGYTASTVSDKTGYSLAADQSSVTVGTVTDVTNETTADVTKISGSATAADNLEASALGIVSTTVNDAGASTTAFVITSSVAVNDHFNGRVIVFTSGTLANQATDITDYVGSTRTVTVTALTSAPANGVSFVIV